MTDWARVARLRKRGKSWREIASDRKVGFQAPSGADPGRALRLLYSRHRSAEVGAKSRSTTPSSSPSRLQRIFARRRLPTVIGMALVVALAVALYLYVSAPAIGANVVTYCGGEGTSAHYHVLLIIDDNGVQQRMPYDPGQSSDIGYIDQAGFTNPGLYCSDGGIHAIHTHDGSGILHLELPSSISLNPPPTLGDFFQIWGEPLSSSGVWSFSGQVTAQVHYTYSDQTVGYSSNPASIPLAVPPGGPNNNPYVIPQHLIFDGAYGNGDSGGMFSGEIIWLNVTGS